MEIEKKFLLKKIPENLADYRKKEIEQGYLCTGPVIRIRKSNEDYILTYKARKMTDSDEGNMTAKRLLVNREEELPLTKEAYEHLKGKTDGKLIAKTRYLIPIEGSLTVELDVFHGFFQGLVLAEVEFPSVEAGRDFVAPDWFGEDVSGDERYTNSYLSRTSEKFW